MSKDLARYRAARDFLLAHRSDHDAAQAGFRWPQLAHFNWALDHFDDLARDNHSPALWIVADDGSGLAGDFEVPRQGSFGLTLIRMLSEQLEGTFSIMTDAGTRFVVRFPEESSS